MSAIYPQYPPDPIDWFLLRLGTAEMKEVFNERNFIEKILKVESALAQAEADLGVIPNEAAEAIASSASFEYLDLEKVGRRLQETGGHFLVAIIDTWRRQVGNLGEYVHWGATTQDIVDTAMVLMVRDGNSLILRDLLKIKGSLVALVEHHKDTPMVGRTHLVHAVPMTFGLKVSVWLDEVSRHIERFEDLKKRLYVGNLTGAVGTFASFGEKGPEIERLTLQKLGLGVPDVCWHAARDRPAENLSVLAMTASTLSKIAGQILLLMRPEINEVEEPIPPGHVGSSTMPQKRNPVMSEVSVALAKFIRAYAQIMNECMETSDERGRSTWFAEFILIPESYLLMSTILNNMKVTLSSLVVHRENMRRNLGITRGMVNSEAVMMALAKRIGRQKAHHVLYNCVTRAYAEKKTFLEVLLTDKVVSAHLSKKDLESLLDPEQYLGLSSSIADKVGRLRSS